MGIFSKSLNILKSLKKNIQAINTSVGKKDLLSNIPKIKIGLSSFIFILLAVLFGLKNQLIILLLSTTLHELAHVFMAKYYKCKTTSIVLTPLGEKANIIGIDNKKNLEKIMIYLVGPTTNFIIFLIFKALNMKEIYSINLALCLLNILPCIPFDGGRIIEVFINCYFSELKSNKILLNISNFVKNILFVMGIIQVVLFPYNISLLCISMYIKYHSKKNYIKSSVKFYCDILSGGYITNKKIAEVKEFYVKKDTYIFDVVGLLSRNKIIKISVENEIINITQNEIVNITQNEIVEYIACVGLSGTIENIVAYIKKDNI